MKALSQVINKLNVLHIRFVPDGGPEMTLCGYSIVKGSIKPAETRSLSDPAAEKDALSKVPLIAAVSGKGVITKEQTSGGIVETVTSDPETFLWTVSDGKISFVRREQLAAVTTELADAGISMLYTECLSGADEGSLARVAEKFRSEHLTWKKILKPSEEGSLLAAHLAKRIQLPVLGILLLMLMANFMVSSGVREDFQAANAELAALRKSTSAAAAGSDRKQAAIEQFAERLPYRFSWLSDRIAASVPDKIILSELAVSPVTKSIEAGKPVQQNKKVVIIRGETTSSESIAAFVEALGALETGKVRLSSVEQDRERAVMTFRIEIEL